MSKKQMGRPPKAVGELRKVTLNIKLKTAERALIDKVAGGEPTIWARETLLKAARRILGKTTEKTET